MILDNDISIESRIDENAKFAANLEYYLNHKLPKLVVQEIPELDSECLDKTRKIIVPMFMLSYFQSVKTRAELGINEAELGITNEKLQLQVSTKLFNWSNYGWSGWSSENNSDDDFEMRLEDVKKTVREFLYEMNSKYVIILPEK